MTCAWFERLCRIPFTGLRLRLCRRHVEGCPRCSQASTSGETLPPVLVTPEQLTAALDLWPEVRAKIAFLDLAEPGLELVSPSRPWRWAYAAAMTVLLLVAGFWIIEQRSGPPSGSSASRPAVQTRLRSAKIADKPARVFQFQSRNPDRTIFWIAKDNKRS